MKSTDPLLFHVFGQSAFVSIDSINPDFVHFTVASRMETLLYTDFLQQWGGAPYDDKYTIANVLQPLHFILTNIRQLHYDECCSVELVAQWQERNGQHYRVHDSFGGVWTFRFEQDGAVRRSEHESWESVD